MKFSLTAATVFAIGGAALATPTFHTTTGFAHLYSVSNEGTAAGAYATEHAIWNPVEAIQMGIGGRAGSGQVMISDNGRYIGATAEGSDGRAEMGRYDRTTGAWTTFGGVGGYSGTTRSSAWGMSPDGSYIVGFGYGTYTGSGSGTFTGVRPTLWQEGVGMVDFSYIPTANSINRIEAVTNSGVAAGYARFPASSSPPVGVYWGAGVGSQQGLTLGGTSALTEAVDISADGRYVAGHGSLTTADGATVISRRPYIADTVTGDTVLIESVAGLNGNEITSNIGYIEGFMTGLTEDAGTAVGFFRARSTGNTPLIDKVWGFIWTEATGAVSFDAWVAELGAPDLDAYYYVPTAISNDGSVIAGYRYARVGPYSSESFMITNIPAPATAALLPMFGAMALRRRR